MKNDLNSSLAPAGHSYASGFSARSFSRTCAINQLWSGLDQILFAHKLAELDVSQISEKLKNIQATLKGAGVLANITGGTGAERELGKRFGSFGPPRPRNPVSQEMMSFLDISEFKPNKNTSAAVFTSPSLQIGFASISLNASLYGSPLQAAELVLAHQLSTGALWEDIRMKGGAYGASAQPDHLEGPFSFSTYRDPTPLRSLDAFASIIRKGSQDNDNADSGCQNDSLEKAIIGTYSRETRPRTPAEKGIADFLRFLCGIEDSHRERHLKGIIDTSAEQLDAAQRRLAEECDVSKAGNIRPVVIAGKAEAEKAAAHLGVEVQTLPV